VAEIAPMTNYLGGKNMPFKKTATGKYKGPSGKTYTKKQVRAYYATKGFSRPVRKKSG
jgi:hypothetical protein